MNLQRWLALIGFSIGLCATLANPAGRRFIDAANDGWVPHHGTARNLPAPVLCDAPAARHDRIGGHG